MRGLVVVVIVLVALAVLTTLCVGQSQEKRNDPMPSDDELEELGEGPLGMFRLALDLERVQRQGCELASIPAGGRCVVCILPGGWLAQDARLIANTAGVRLVSLETGTGDLAVDACFAELAAGADKPAEVTLTCQDECPKEGSCCQRELGIGSKRAAALQVKPEGGAFAVSCGGPGSCSVTLEP
jgi:hypothetical protein